MVKTYFRKHIALLFLQIDDKCFKHRRIELISRNTTCTKGQIDNFKYDRMRLVVYTSLIRSSSQTTQQNVCYHIYVLGCPKPNKRFLVWLRDGGGALINVYGKVV